MVANILSADPPQQTNPEGGVNRSKYYALLCVHSSFAITLKRKRKLVALLSLSYRCSVIINVLWLFLTVPWVRLQCVILVFPDHTLLLFDS